MAEIAVKPYMMQDAVLRIVADDFAAACSAIALIPSSSIVVFKGLKKDSKSSFPTGATWVCNLTYAQDWETAGSLSRLLHDHEGETLAAQILPQTQVVDPEDPDELIPGTGFDVQLIIVPGQIGGAGDQVAGSTVSLGVNGRPTYIDEESS
jgi:hypothetical protein